MNSDIFVGDVKELVRSCISFYKLNKKKMNIDTVHQRRSQLSRHGELFHKSCGTLTHSVKKRIDEFREKAVVVLMTAHQPNLFAYSGVLRKATLNFVLSKKLEDTLKVPVVSFFGIADQDFAADRWVRSCQLPDVQRSGGIFSLEAGVAEKMMLCSLPKPSIELLHSWKKEIGTWLNSSMGSVERLSRKLGLPPIFFKDSQLPLVANLESFWRIVEECHERSKTYSDFNAFLMSRIVNDLWGYDSVFARFSECQQAFTQEFCFLLSQHERYSDLLSTCSQTVHSESVGSRPLEQESQLVPFWYHCDCGSKARLTLEKDENGNLHGKGNCLGCGKYSDLGFGLENNPCILDFSSRISARAISMCLVFFKGLVPLCYVGGIGGAEYLVQTKQVADGLCIPFPPVALWRPHDKYLGIGQIHALLELKRICKKLGVNDISSAKLVLKSRISEIYESLNELDEAKTRMLAKLGENDGSGEAKKEIETISKKKSAMIRSSGLSVVAHELRTADNILAILELMPSIIDYAVNIGMSETSSQWIRYLDKDEDLSSDVPMESILSRDIPNLEISIR